MEKPEERYKHKGLVIEIYADENPQSPRKDDNVGTIVAWHRRYNLGDGGHRSEYNNPQSTKAEYLADLEAQGAVVLPLYLYDHSGITISTGSFQDADWDSSMVGFIFTLPDKVEAEYPLASYPSEAQRREAVIKILTAEIEVFDQYLRGDAYGYQILKPVKCETCGHIEEEKLDSCWGYYGIERCKEEAEAAANHEAAQAAA